MYIEIILIGIIIFFLLIYTGTISTSNFFGENKGLFSMLQEKDYEFLLRAKYGDRVYDVSQVFRKRVMQGLIAMAITLFIFLSNLKPLYLLISVVIGYVVFKAQYLDLRKFYKKHLNTIDSLLPYYLKTLEVLVQHYTVPVALARSIEDAPEVFKPGLRELVDKIEKELLPELFFKNETEQWIFFYAFCRRLNDEAIGVRVYLDKTNIYRKELQIIENNLSKITHFLDV